MEINWIRMLLLFPGVPLNLASISSDFQLGWCEVRGSEKEEERETERVGKVSPNSFGICSVA